ncbi:DUF3750 domain-containing protein [Halofilum ochraceum]|uniref:DUF3750 domain-containing protein n=1 Tax=Halofilum ochraceum TaxID=1611323 RepID=UPI0008DA63BD|nr:DUF3750 domain-containing protein [Halofilum ochraceum]
MRWVLVVLSVIVLLAVGPLVMAVDRGLQLDARWYDAGRESAGLAPDPAAHEAALVQVYAARAFGWRGILGAHTWIAVKARGAGSYRLLQVTRWSGGVSFSDTSLPDRAWFGNEPVVLAQLRGEEAGVAIAAIEEAAGHYPWPNEYRIWPGPNSNTFVAWMLRRVPTLDAELPPTAIGKDYLGSGWYAKTPSNTGYQVSLGGLLGVTVARDEGLELNLLGAVLGIDPEELAIKLPAVGRVGFGGTQPAG